MYNQTEYTKEQIAYAIENYVEGYDSDKNFTSKDYKSFILEAKEILPDLLAGTEGILAYVEDCIDEGVYGDISDQLIPYIDERRLADDLLANRFEEDEHANVYRPL